MKWFRGWETSITFIDDTSLITYGKNDKKTLSMKFLGCKVRKWIINIHNSINFIFYSPILHISNFNHKASEQRISLCFPSWQDHKYVFHFSRVLMEWEKFIGKRRSFSPVFSSLRFGEYLKMKKQRYIWRFWL